MPQTRNRVPRLRRGVRDWTRLTAHERGVFDALYRAPVGLTFAELCAETGVGKAAMLAAVQGLCDPRRCRPLNCSGPALDRSERLAPAAPLYTVTPQWLLTHRPHGPRS